MQILFYSHFPKNDKISNDDATKIEISSPDNLQSDFAKHALPRKSCVVSKTRLAEQYRQPRTSNGTSNCNQTIESYCNTRFKRSEMDEQ